MSDNKRGTARRSGGQRPRRKANTFVTKSGQTIKINRSLSQRIRAKREARARRKAERLAGMPKGRWNRLAFRLNPKRLWKYWTSREGGIMALKVLGIGLLAGFILLVGIFAYFRKDLPNLRDISGNNIGGSIRYYDRTGQTLLWEDYDAVKRIPVKDEDISPAIKQATIAVEDKDFFKHGGFDMRGIIRAGWNNVTGSSGGTQGGSTITQQLVKLSQDWTKDRTYTRKVKELILAVELERSYSKQEILTGYLNTAPYGSIDYGVEAAARDYFQKSAKDLTLEEATLLAAMPKSPSLYSPYSPGFDKEALVGRQYYVLDLMEQQGMISREQRDNAKKVDVLATVKPRKPKYEGITAPYFVLTAKEELEERFGAQTVQRGGWKVITTLDMNAQAKADEQVQKGLAQVRRQGGDSIAFAAEDVETGQMVALVGGVDFSNPEYGQNNYARYRLPPGSSFKPYDYLGLIEHSDKYGAGTVLYDTQGPMEGYPCTNKARPQQGGNCLYDYDFRYPGPLTLRYSLGGSRNVPAVKAMLITGVDKTIETAEKLGLKSGYNCYQDDALTKEGQCYASSAIGDGAYLKLDEHIHAYASISRNGLNLPQTYILKIEDAGGKTVDEWKMTKGDQAVRPDSAYIVADMLSDPRASYFSRKPHTYKGWKFGLKTGTTNDTKDGLLMGFSTKYSAGVWVGYHNRRVEMRGFMENMTQPIWSGWMNSMHDNIQPKERPKPEGVKTMPAYVVRSHVGVGSIEPSPTNDLFPSWYQGKKGTNKKQTIDIVSNKLATDCTPPRARKDVFDGDANSYSGDTIAQNSATTNQTDDVHKCEDLKPGIRLTITPLGGSSYRLSADVTQGTHPLSSDKYPGTVTFKVNGQVPAGGTINVGGPGVVSVDYNANFSGSATVTAEVVDSVLYDATDTGTITGSGGGGASLEISTAKAQGANTKFEWDNQSGTVTIYKASNNAALCSGSNGSDNDCQVAIAQAPIGTQVYAKDGNGNTSAVVTVTN